MKKVNVSDLKEPGDHEKYPKDTVFVMDNSEKEIKVPESLKKNAAGQ